MRTLSQPDTLIDTVNRIEQHVQAVAICDRIREATSLLQLVHYHITDYEHISDAQQNMLSDAVGVGLRLLRQGVEDQNNLADQLAVLPPSKEH